MLRSVFVILLAVGIVGSYLTYRVHRRIWPLLLLVLASVLLYISIYVVPSDPLYYASLVLLVIGTIWNVRTHPSSIPGATVAMT